MIVKPRESLTSTDALNYNVNVNIGSNIVFLPQMSNTFTHEIGVDGAQAQIQHMAERRRLDQLEFPLPTETHRALSSMGDLGNRVLSFVSSSTGMREGQIKDLLLRVSKSLITAGASALHPALGMAAGAVLQAPRSDPDESYDPHTTDYNLNQLRRRRAKLMDHSLMQVHYDALDSALAAIET